MQPYRDKTAKIAKNRITGTFVGAFWGLVVILIQLYVIKDVYRVTFLSYMMISLFTGVVLYSTVMLNVKDTSYFSCVVFLSITVMHMTDANPFVFVFNRVMDTLIGVGLAIMVNSIHLPRKKNTDILFVSGIDDTILAKNNELAPYSKVELNRLIDTGANFTVSTIRTPASVRESMEGINLKLPVIAMDGAVLYDMNENLYLKKYIMSPSQAETISTFLENEGIIYFTNTIIDNLLVIYYDSLVNEAMKDIYRKKRNSPYRNYVKKHHPVFENIVYLYLIDEKEKVDKLVKKLMEQPWICDFRVVYDDSVDYPGYTYMKIYHKDATREHMLMNLQAMLNMNKIVTFGSIEGKYDVYIQNADKDHMVKKLKKLFEPVGI